MDITGLKIGMMHSLIGKNDGVSIVIDQTIAAMSEHLDIRLDNMFFLAGHSAPRMQTKTNDILWHRNEPNRYILEHFSGEAPEGLDEYIYESALKAKKIIADFVDKNELDLFLIHNGCHPSNFVYAVAAGMFFEERRKEGVILPRYLLWWHDSHFERERFAKPNAVIKKYLQYIPGPHVDGIVFINSEQEAMARKYAEAVEMKNIDLFFERKTCTIPNTCDIHWDWQKIAESDQPLAEPMDDYNLTFFKEIGLLDMLAERGQDIDDAVFLLQHTRVVQRKRIDHAINFAFKMRQRYAKAGSDKSIVLMISGHSGDEHDPHQVWLEDYYNEMCEKYPEDANRVLFIFAEHWVFPHREVLVNRKFYAFGEIPTIIAKHGGMGTYFSEVEGYGNNLLEMMSAGLPVIINEYEIYKTDIKELGFDLVCTENGDITDEAIEASYKLLTDPDYRRACVKHNLQTLQDKLNHEVMAKSLGTLIENLFRYC